MTSTPIDGPLQLPIPYWQGGPGHVAGSGTSSDAAAAIQPTASALRQRILQAVEAAGDQGRTCDELQVELGLLAQTCSARCSELRSHPVHGGRLEKRKDERGREIRRPTRSGCMAAVLFLAPPTP